MVTVASGRCSSNFLQKEFAACVEAQWLRRDATSVSEKIHSAHHGSATAKTPLDTKRPSIHGAFRNKVLTLRVSIGSGPPLTKDEHVLKKLIDRILFGRYEAAKREGILRIIARYSRGNTAIQNGKVLDEAGLSALRKRGDAAAAKMARAERRASRRSMRARTA